MSWFNRFLHCCNLANCKGVHSAIKFIIKFSNKIPKECFDLVQSQQVVAQSWHWRQQNNAIKFFITIVDKNPSKNTLTPFLLSLVGFAGKDLFRVIEKYTRLACWMFFWILFKVNTKDTRMTSNKGVLVLWLVNLTTFGTLIQKHPSRGVLKSTCFENSLENNGGGVYF